MKDLYGGQMVCNRRPTKVDAFVVRVSESADILNLKKLEKWIGNKGYFRWYVYILDMVPRIREHGDRARAALAKAGGEVVAK